RDGGRALARGRGGHAPDHPGRDERHRGRGASPPQEDGRPCARRRRGEGGDPGGIDSIEHGSFLDEEALRLMKERGTWLVPTLLAGEYVSGKAAPRHYPPEIAAKAKAAIDARSTAVRKALAAGVKIAFGTDAAVGPHGANAKEFALLVDHGMTPAAALRSATSGA